MGMISMLHGSLMAVAAQTGPSGQQNPILAMAPFFLMFIIFYFLLIRPQKRRQVEHQKMLDGLKKGDKVVTSGGILGTVLGVKDKTVVLKVGEGETKIEFLKSAVNSINNTEVESNK